MQALALLKVFMVGLAQMSGLSIEQLAGMAQEISRVAQETAGGSLCPNRNDT